MRNTGEHLLKCRARMLDRHNFVPCHLVSLVSVVLRHARTYGLTQLLTMQEIIGCINMFKYYVSLLLLLPLLLKARGC